MRIITTRKRKWQKLRWQNKPSGLIVWSTNPGSGPRQVELLVNTDVAQPVGTKAYEALTFKDPTAGKQGPSVWQMHNKGLFDQYEDVRIKVNPAEEKLITVE